MKDTLSLVELTLWRSDRELIRKYGYPFPRVEAAIDAVPASQDEAIVPCDAYEVEMLLGDLARSINECTDDDLQDCLNDLYESIESEVARQRARALGRTDRGGG